MLVGSLIAIFHLFESNTHFFGDMLMDRSRWPTQVQIERQHYALGVQDAARGARLTDGQMDRAKMTAEQRKAYRAGYGETRYAQ